MSDKIRIIMVASKVIDMHEYGAFGREQWREAIIMDPISFVDGKDIKVTVSFEDQ